MHLNPQRNILYLFKRKTMAINNTVSMETEASNLKHRPLWPLSEGVIMNTARMHRAGAIQSRHYTHKNMNAVGGGGSVFVLPRFRGKGVEWKSGCSYFVWGFTRK
jgi:hypothetical protein